MRKESGIIALLTILLVFSCGGEPEDTVPRMSLLLKPGAPLNGVRFRPPARTQDIKGFGWDTARAARPYRIWLYLNDRSPVITPAPGRVVYADNQGKDGSRFLVEILHGTNMKTTISGLDRITVREGDILRPDAVIGRASGYFHIGLSVLRPGSPDTSVRTYRARIAREQAWIPVYTAPYILGQGGE